MQGKFKAGDKAKAKDSLWEGELYESSNGELHWKVITRTNGTSPSDFYNTVVYDPEYDDEILELLK